MMAIDVRGEWIRARARAAREVSAELREESLALGQVARTLRDAGRSRRVSVDDGIMAWSATRPFLEPGLIGFVEPLAVGVRPRARPRPRRGS